MNQDLVCFLIVDSFVKDFKLVGRQFHRVAPLVRERERRFRIL